ncbi:MAG: glycosyltransferase [Candidatus Rokubacteria bacterium]|nr:glycosyltransferase [Candidatus Rokubacteria bacterium]
MAKFSAPNVHERAGDTGAPRTLVYAGSVGTWYMLGEMLDFFSAVRARDPGLSFLILNRGGHDVIVRAVEARRLEGVRVVAAAPDEVPDHLSRAYAGIYFIKPVFSKSGASPTKLGEYLAAGLPVVVNAGVGDADQLVASTGVGVVVDRFSADEYVARWDELTAMIARGADFRRHCRETARPNLGLDLGIERYGAVYDSLLAGPAVRARGREEGQLERHATRIP